MGAYVPPKYTAQIPGGTLEVVAIVQNAQRNISVKHRFNRRNGVSTLKQTARGERYFYAQGDRVYVADLKKVQEKK